MARVQFTSMEAYRKAVLSGKVTTIKDRVMRFLFRVGRPVTRRECENYFDPSFEGFAIGDGGKRIRWSSMTGSIAGLVSDRYVRVMYEDKCPVTGETSQFIAPADDSWFQRRMF